MSKVVVIGLSGESVFLNVDHFNNSGETVKAIDRFVEPGGKGYNQALMLGKLGVDVSFITVLGDDAYAKECVRVLKEHKVKTYVITKKGLTDYAVITTDNNGENHVIVSDNLSKSITYSDILKYQKVIDEADIVLLQLEYPYEVTKKIIQYCYEKGIKIVLNPAPAKIIDLDILKKVNVLIPNEFEVFHLIDDEFTNVKDVLKELELYGIETSIVTCGSKNVISYHNSKYKEHKVEPIKAIDTTGAGDIFCASCVYGLSQNMNLDSTIDFAINASRLSVTKRGVVESLPNLNEILLAIQDSDKE